MPMATKLGREVTYSEGLPLIKCDPVTSRNQLRLLYLHYHSVYGHDIWWDGDLSWRAPDHKVT